MADHAQINDEDETDYLWDLTENLCKVWGKLSNEQEDERMKLEKENAEAEAYKEAVEVIKQATKENEESMDEESDESAESSEAESEYEKPHGYEWAPVDEYVENARGYEEFRKRQKLSK